MSRPFKRKDGSTGYKSSRYLYEVEIKERATYKVFVRGGCAAEAIQLAEKHFLSTAGISIGDPWSVEVHDRRCEATVQIAKEVDHEEVLP